MTWTHTPNDPFLSAEEITALGQIVVIWGQIEADLQHIIWEYLGGDPVVGATLTAGLQLDAKCRLLSSIAKLKEDIPQQHESLTELMKRLEKLRDTRNDVFHGYWIGSAPKSYKKDLKAGIHPYDFDSTPRVDLLAFRDKSGALAHDLWKFMGTTMILKFPITPDPTGSAPT
jgi:hypothetical protein